MGQTDFELPGTCPTKRPVIVVITAINTVNIVRVLCKLIIVLIFHINII